MSVAKSASGVVLASGKDPVREPLDIDPLGRVLHDQVLGLYENGGKRLQSGAQRGVAR